MKCVLLISMGIKVYMYICMYTITCGMHACTCKGCMRGVCVSTMYEGRVHGVSVCVHVYVSFTQYVQYVYNVMYRLCVCVLLCFEEGRF